MAVGAVALLAATHRRRQTLIVERALYPEVNSMRFQAAAFAGELARRHVAGIPLDAAFFSYWRLSAPLVYPAAGVELGHLSSDTLDRVGYFHAQLAEARSRVAEAKIRGAEALSTYRLLSNVLRACNQVEPWITSKDSLAGNLIGGEADVGEAARLLEDFEIDAKEPLALAYCWADVCDPSNRI
jgi:hypothetical protein